MPVYAPASGKVIIARWLSGYGNYVMIDHGDGYYTGFGHLSGFSVSQGQTVSRGQQIATSGNTGITTGPHLHYEVYIGGRIVLVYGKNVALEMLKNPKNVQKVLLQKGFDDKKILSLLKNSNFPVQIKSKQEIDRLSEGVHQGIILYVRDYQYYTLSDVLKDNPSFIVMLDHIEDPHNFGAIVRTCEAAGVDAIIIPKNRQAQVNATVMKTSVGTLNQIKVVQVANLPSTMDYLKQYDFWIVGTALEDSIDYRSIDYSGKIVLVVGNEGVGISKLVRNKCDFIAKIPMYGTTNSLNASVASGIMIYEVIRNRK